MVVKVRLIAMSYVNFTFCFTDESLAIPTGFVCIFEGVSIPTCYNWTFISWNKSWEICMILLTMSRHKEVMNGLQYSSLRIHSLLICSSFTYTNFTYNRLDLSFSKPKVISRSPSYQPMQKFFVLAAANYLQICCFWAKTCKLICWYPGSQPRVILCSLSQVSGTMFMWFVPLLVLLFC